MEAKGGSKRAVTNWKIKSQSSEQMRMVMTLDWLKSYQASGTVLSAFHASSHLILKTSPRDIIIPIWVMRKLCFIVKYLARRHTRSQEVAEPKFKPKVSNARPHSLKHSWHSLSAAKTKSGSWKKGTEWCCNPTHVRNSYSALLQLYFIHLKEISSVYAPFF